MNQPEKHLPSFHIRNSSMITRQYGRKKSGRRRLSKWKDRSAQKRSPQQIEILKNIFVLGA